MHHNPAISVLMSVYNEDEVILEKSIQSILRQTFSDFEFLITDDCSSNGCTNILNKYQKSDERIKVFHNKENIGLTKSLVSMANEAQGRFLARIDSDDISITQRFEVQINHFLDNPNLVLLGGLSVEIDEHEKEKKQESKTALAHDDLVSSFPLFNPFIHSTVMIRANSYHLVGGYDTSYKYSQDIDLFYRLSRVGEIKNLNRVLVKRNIKKDSISSKFNKDQLRYAIQVRQLAQRDYRKSWLRYYFYMAKSQIKLLLK